MKDFAKYLRRFEVAVCEVGATQNVLGRDELVPVSSCRLEKTRFGRLMGWRIDSDFPFAINYYGYIKRSTGFFASFQAARAMAKEAQIKSLVVPVVNFASIKLEKMARLAPTLVVDFAAFKKAILDARGFKHQYEA